MKQRIEKVCSK